MSNVYESKHPLVAHKLSRLRDKNTEPKKFRELVREIAGLLAYESTLNLQTEAIEIETPLQKMPAQQLKEKIGLVPILRAGLGMVEGIWELMPSAEVWHIGLYRDEKTLQPVEYYNKLPVDPRVAVCLILDPMLATGGSATATASILKKWGVKKIKYVGLIAAPEGIKAMQTAHPDIDIYVAAIDSHLNEKGYIVPGLGDAGDRQFGTG
ncbi:MAG: uracil phosphoribosyltransferase [Chloroflexi bacterium OLB14]|nr:MAG: uracil phosphoribosyltransferase [Chloroflexi bacterium OLB14]